MPLALELYARPSKPSKNLLSAYLRKAAEARFMDQWTNGTPHDHTRLLSASGFTAGKSLCSPLNNKSAGYADESFRTAILWRLGELPKVEQCCLNSYDSDYTRICPDALGLGDEHETECSVGPMMNSRHNAMCEVWCRIADQTRALVRREILVP